MSGAEKNGNDILSCVGPNSAEETITRWMEYSEHIVHRLTLWPRYMLTARKNTDTGPLRRKDSYCEGRVGKTEGRYIPIIATLTTAEPEN